MHTSIFPTLGKVASKKHCWHADQEDICLPNSLHFEKRSQFHGFHGSSKRRREAGGSIIMKSWHYSTQLIFLSTDGLFDGWSYSADQTVLNRRTNSLFLCLFLSRFLEGNDNAEPAKTKDPHLNLAAKLEPHGRLVSFIFPRLRRTHMKTDRRNILQRHKWETCPYLGTDKAKKVEKCLIAIRELVWPWAALISLFPYFCATSGKSEAGDSSSEHGEEEY